MTFFCTENVVFLFHVYIIYCIVSVFKRISMVVEKMGQLVSEVMIHFGCCSVWPSQLQISIRGIVERTKSAKSHKS